MGMGEGNKCLKDKKRGRVTNCESFDFICIERIDQCFFCILTVNTNMWILPEGVPQYCKL